MSTTAKIFSRPLSGDRIPAKIKEGLECSCVLLLCMSANAVVSDCVQWESSTLRTGQRPFRDPQNKERRFLPLCFDVIEIKSGSDWAQLESGTLRTGQRPFRDPLNEERRFLPLRLDGQLFTERRYPSTSGFWRKPKPPMRSAVLLNVACKPASSTHANSAP